MAEDQSWDWEQSLMVGKIVSALVFGFRDKQEFKKVFALQNRKKQLDKQICAGIVTFEPTDIGLTFIFIQTVWFEITFDWNMMREASALQYGAFIICKTSAAI